MNSLGQLLRDAGSPARAGAWPFIGMAGSILGAAAQLQQTALWSAGVYAAWLVGGVALAILTIGLNRIRASCTTAAGWAIVLVAGVCCGAGLAGWRAVAYASHALDPSLEGRDLRIVARVVTMPRRNPTGLQMRLDVQSAEWVSATGSRKGGRAEPLPVDAAAAPPQLPAHLWIGWYDRNAGFGATRTPTSNAAAKATGAAIAENAADPHSEDDGSALPGPSIEDAAQTQLLPDLKPSTVSDVRAGDLWTLTVRLTAPHGNLNPWGFDYELWMWERDLQATGYVRDGPRDAAPRLLTGSWRHPVERVRQAVRDAIDRQVPDRQRAGVIAALVTGDQSGIEQSDWDVFRATGVSHLVSISGLHITLFAWLASISIGWAWRRADGRRMGRALALRTPTQRAALIGGVVLAVGYAIFSGWGVPQQRTVWMLATVALLRLAGLRWPWPLHWLTACTLVVAVDPWALTQAGFWLSFVAVGMLFAMNSGATSAGTAGAGGRFIQNMRLQAAITLALAPLSLLLFQQVSVVGLIANAAAIPFVTFVVLPLSLLGAVVAPVWTLASWSVEALGSFLGWLASWPFASLWLPAPPLWAALAGVAGAGLIALRLPWRLRALGIPLLLPVLMWQQPRPAAGAFELMALDIGQGNALVVRTAHHALLYDAGPRYGEHSDAGQRAIVPWLRAMGERLDIVMLSHRDSDHVGGASAVLASQSGARLIGSIEISHPLQAVRPVERCVDGQQWTWDGVRFEVLHPLAADYDTPAKSNAMSCVLRISSGQTAALLAGDIERAQEQLLVARSPPGALQADLLLVPHHGSKTSSSDALLDAVAPRVALVQAGYRNRFGHPAAPVMARYQMRSIVVQDSAHCGAALWSSTVPDAIRCERAAARHYWHHQVPTTSP